MKIIFFSPNFHPMIGGLENVVRDWALGLTRCNHQIKVITLTSASIPDSFPFEIYRNISLFKMWKLMRNADVVVQHNVSLKGLLPCLLSFRPLVISLHGTNLDINGKWFRYGRLKQFVADYLSSGNTACSSYVASFFKNTTVVHSPYNASLFKKINNGSRRLDVVFLGRLVSDKGCEVVLKAIAILRSEYAICVRLTVIGVGPEKARLLALSNELNIQDQINFIGTQVGHTLVEILNEHKVMIVPSIWEEPFGIVALEGLACGCKVIVSKSGGLVEAVGDYGATFKKGDAKDLAGVLKNVLSDEIKFSDAEIASHLNNFTVESSVMKLVESLSQAIE